MPSALETLVKILKLEREQGYKNTAVTNGLTEYVASWTPQAHTQARIPEHHALVDEIHDTLRPYDALDTRDARHEAVQYTMDRIFRKLPPPEGFEARVAYYVANMPAANMLTANDATAGASAEEAATSTRAEARRERLQKQRQTRGESQDSTPEASTESERKERKGKGEQPAPARAEERKKGQPNRANAPAKQPQTALVSGSEDEPEEREKNPEHSDLEFEIRGTAPGKMDIAIPARLMRPPRLPRPALDPEEATDLLRGLRAPVTTMKGIGDANAEMLNKLGIRTVQDLLFYLPRRYDDYMSMSYISHIKPDEMVTLIGTVQSAEMRIGRGGRKDFFMVVDDGSGAMQVTFFGQHFLSRQIRPGQQVLLHGKVTFLTRAKHMANPEWEFVDIDDLKHPGIVPVYGLTEGIRNKAMRRLMKRAVEYWAEHLPDYVPTATLDRAELADLGWAIKNLHFPESWDHLEHARRRYIFDQLLLLQLAILANRRAWQSVPGVSLPVGDGELDTFLAAVFPYPLTGAQQRSIADIRRDIAQPMPMNRLLQGDVGSGKTAVALAAMAMAYMNGKQSVLMAPTSILAEQHYRNITRAMENYPGEQKPRVALLTGSRTAAERNEVLRGLADGSIGMAVGTHALISENVEYHDLALAVIDEQHRFGVEQRGALRGKGTNPHLLVMTATPIPRTLALTMYADLDLSIIDEMPPGRTPVKTHVIEPVARERAYRWIEDTFLSQHQQAFIVYPLVEASERIDAESAVEAHDKLSKVFYKYNVGLLHGKMKPAEKDAVMADFRERRYDVLVTTSVAEVGVDIPNAAVILIESANRFGLASLHQFRGRVGRGGLESVCLLMCDTQDKAARDRLDVMKMVNDGFRLAEADWRLRGAGDLVGTRQSGQNRLQLVEQMSPELVELAQREARTLYEEDIGLSQPQHRLLAERVQLLRDERSDLS